MLIIIWLHHEHLIYTRRVRHIQGGGHVKKVLKSHETTLRHAIEGLELPAKGGANTLQQGTEDASSASFPRYVRVNTLKTTLAEAITELARILPQEDIKVRLF